MQISSLFFPSTSNLTPKAEARRLNKGQAVLFLTVLFQLASFAARLSLWRWLVGRLVLSVCVLCFICEDSVCS